MDGCLKGGNEHGSKDGTAVEPAPYHHTHICATRWKAENTNTRRREGNNAGDDEGDDGDDPSDNKLHWTFGGIPMSRNTRRDDGDEFVVDP